MKNVYYVGGSPDVMNVILKDEKLANKLGKNARLRYEQNFSGEALGKAYLMAYQDVL